MIDCSQRGKHSRLHRAWLFTRVSAIGLVFGATSALAVAPGVVIPDITVGNASALEGNAGTTTLNIPLARSGDTTENIAVQYQTDVHPTNPATAGTDYVSISAGNALLPPGTTSLNLPVSIFGDTNVEADENFFLHVTSVLNVGPTPNLAAQLTFDTDAQPYSVTTADINGDGRPDLIVANYGAGTVSVLLNTSAPGTVTPSFATQQTFATGSGAISVAAADVNGDGLPDLVVASRNSNTVTVLLNTTTPGAATASFATQQNFATGNLPFSVAVADVNGDGKLDLMSANYLSNTVSVLLNTTAPGAATASFATQQTFATGVNPISVAIADVNGDGRRDLLVANNDSNTVSVLLNTTTPGAVAASFTAQQTFVTGLQPYSVTAADVNGDGRLDLMIANSGSSTVSVLLNTATPGATTANFATQQTFATGAAPICVTATDFNGDGRPDLILTNAGSASLSVLLNTTVPGAATTSFAAQQSFSTGANPFSVAAADVNGDGRPDLMVANYGSSTVSVLLNTTTPPAPPASFASASNFAPGSLPVFVALGDVNGDGVPDLELATQGGDATKVQLNITAPGVTSPGFSGSSSFTAGVTPTAVAVGDVNGDGRPDLAIANNSNLSNNVSVLLNTTAAGPASGLGAVTPNYTAAINFGVGTNPSSVAMGDINGDGRPDLAVSHSAGVAVLLNTTTAGPASGVGAVTPSFTTATNFAAGAGSSVAMGDVNGDGRPDLVVANSNGNVSVLLNTTLAGPASGAGAVTPSFVASSFAAGTNPNYVAVGDVNGDGRPDLIVANSGDNNVSVLLNTAPAGPASGVGAVTPGFATAVNFRAGTTPLSVALGDVNGDGRLDLIVGNLSSNDVSVLINTTTPGPASGVGAVTPSFVDTVNFGASTGPRSVAVGDINGDGRPDIVVANQNGNVSVLINKLYSVTLSNDKGVGTIQNDDFPPRTLSVATDGTGTGTVTATGIDCGGSGHSDCSEDYANGTPVTLTATADTASSDFSGWSGACTGTALTCDVTMSAARSVTATFTAKRRSLSITTAGTGSGSVTSSPGTINCTAAPVGCTDTFDHGTLVTISAQADTGSGFTGFDGECSPNIALCIVTMDQDKSFIATFTLQKFNLVTSIAGNGSVSGSGINCTTGNVGTCSANLDYSTLVSLTATPDTGYDFTGWSGACEGTGSCNVTMSTAKSVTATFTIQQRSLGVSVNGNGTVTGSGINCTTGNAGACGGSFIYGIPIALTATADANYNFASWSGCDSTTGNICNVTLTAAKSVTATFNLVPVTNPATACPSSPVPSCRATGGASLYFYGPGKRSNIQLLHSDATTAEVGNPEIRGGTDYRVCVYVDNALVSESGITAGDSHFLLFPKGRGFFYINPKNPQKLSSLYLHNDGSVNGTSMNAVVEKAPKLPITVHSSVTAQFINSNACWSGNFAPSDIQSNSTTQFRIRKLR